MFLVRKLILSIFLIFSVQAAAEESKKLAYLVSDINIPFWEIMSRGIKTEASKNGYKVEVLSANNSKKRELQNVAKVIKDKVDGLVISPINSSTATSILKLAKMANIPVTISDIGTDSGEYVSFVSSNNTQGAYQIGKVLTKKMKELGYDKDGSVGIVSIPQKRENGKARTAGFIKAMNEAGIKVGGLKQQIDFSHLETYNHSMELIKNDPNIRAIFLQGSDKYHGALGAIVDSGKKGEILLICFDAEPEFIDIIPRGILVGAAMQQPFLMGEKATKNLIDHINGKRVHKNQQLEILAVSTDNIKEKLPIIKKNVLGLKE